MEIIEFGAVVVAASDLRVLTSSRRLSGPCGTRG
jgi:hypothetical protein